MSTWKFVHVDREDGASELVRYDGAGRFERFDYPSWRPIAMDEAIKAAIWRAALTRVEEE